MAELCLGIGRPTGRCSTPRRTSGAGVGADRANSEPAFRGAEYSFQPLAQAWAPGRTDECSPAVWLRGHFDYRKAISTLGRGRCHDGCLTARIVDHQPCHRTDARHRPPHGLRGAEPMTTADNPFIRLEKQT